VSFFVRATLFGDGAREQAAWERWLADVRATA
jgi:hypothetical protein